VEDSAVGAASFVGCSTGVDDVVAAAAPPRPPLPPLPRVPVPRALPVAVLGGILVYLCPGLVAELTVSILKERDLQAWR
jgi:hypothetical protein